MNINIGAGIWRKEGWLNLNCHSPHYDKQGYLDEYTDIWYNLVSDKPLPFKDEYVDKFYCSMVFEHISDKHVQHTIDECYRCLKRYGSFLVVVPVPLHDVRQFFRRLNMLQWGFSYNHAENGRHINFFTFGKLRKMFMEGGFVSVKKLPVSDIDECFKSYVKLALYVEGIKYGRNIKRRIGRT